MNLPTPLVEEPDFMRLYQGVVLGVADAERRTIDDVIALAFVKGRVIGLQDAIETIRTRPS